MYTRPMEENKPRFAPASCRQAERGKWLAQTDAGTAPARRCRLSTRSSYEPGTNTFRPKQRAKSTTPTAYACAHPIIQLDRVADVEVGRGAGDAEHGAEREVEKPLPFSRVFGNGNQIRGRRIVVQTRCSGLLGHDTGGVHAASRRTARRCTFRRRRTTTYPDTPAASFRCGTTTSKRGPPFPRTSVSTRLTQGAFTRSRKKHGRGQHNGA